MPGCCGFFAYSFSSIAADLTDSHTSGRSSAPRPAASARSTPAPRSRPDSAPPALASPCCKPAGACRPAACRDRGSSCGWRRSRRAHARFSPRRRAPSRAPPTRRARLRRRRRRQRVAQQVERDTPVGHRAARILLEHAAERLAGVAEPVRVQHRDAALELGLHLASHDVGKLTFPSWSCLVLRRSSREDGQGTKEGGTVSARFMNYSCERSDVECLMAARSAREARGKSNHRTKKKHRSTRAREVFCAHAPLYAHSRRAKREAGQRRPLSVAGLVPVGLQAPPVLSSSCSTR